VSCAAWLATALAGTTLLGSPFERLHSRNSRHLARSGAFDNRAAGKEIGAALSRDFIRKHPRHGRSGGPV
jgi:hypothetical protein